jgi:hypothetical protein
MTVCDVIGAGGPAHRRLLAPKLLRRRPVCCERVSTRPGATAFTRTSGASDRARSRVIWLLAADYGRVGPDRSSDRPHVSRSSAVRGSLAVLFVRADSIAAWMTAMVASA